MKQKAGYARVLAEVRIDQDRQGQLFGKPFLKFGQCFGMCAYFLQLGSVLGAKHREKGDLFLVSFLGADSKGIDPANLESEEAQSVHDLARQAKSFSDFVYGEHLARLGFEGDVGAFFQKYRPEKIFLKDAEELAVRFARFGALLGLTNPEKVRELFEGTHHPAKDLADAARANRIDLSPPQEGMTYEILEKGEDNIFMSYCRQEAS